MIRVKVCGITRLEDARFCVNAGVDYLGFVQIPDDERFVSSARAGEIIGESGVPQSVGVFSNADAAAINGACATAGFALVQLDGHEDLETIRAVDVPIIKTIRVQHDASSEHVRAMMAPYVGRVAYFRLETTRTSLWGGEGESFNWRVARDIGRDVPLFISGAITADNAASAVETMAPHALDVNETVERSPGEKDPALIVGLLAAIRAPGP